MSALTSFSVDLSESVVAHFIHQTVEQSAGSLLVDSELSLRGVVVLLLNVSAFICAAPDTHHPQKLIDI